MTRRVVEKLCTEKVCVDFLAPKFEQMLRKSQEMFGPFLYSGPKEFSHKTPGLLRRLSSVLRRF